MAHDVFISYSSKDKSVADAVCAYLENSRMRCWIAPRDITPGNKYGQDILDAIRESKVMVVIFSSNANQSEHVSAEIERAMNKGIIIIPFRIENVMPTGEMEYYLSGRHWLDALTIPMEQHIQTLLKTVGSLLGKQDCGNKENAPGITQGKTPSIKKKRKSKLIVYFAIPIILFILALLLFENQTKPDDSSQKDAAADVQETVSTRQEAPGTEAPVVPAVNNKMGNTNSNITNLGLASISREWIYYRNYSRNGSLYKMKTDGTEKLQVCSDSVFYINVASDWIYYKNDSDGGKIYRIRTDGTGREKLNDDESEYLNIAGNEIFYRNVSDGGKLYKMTLDNKKAVAMNEEDSSFINVQDGWVYYIHNNNIFKIRTNLKGKVKAIDANGCKMIVVEGNVIYWHETSNYGTKKIYAYNIDTSEAFQIDHTDDHSIYNMNVSGNRIFWVFHLNSFYHYAAGINVINKDGTGKLKITDDMCKNLCIAGDFIFTDSGQIWGIE